MPEWKVASDPLTDSRRQGERQEPEQALRACAQVDASRFGRVREALARRYANANMSPGKHAAYLRLRALKHVWDVDAALAELNRLTPAAVQARSPGPSHRDAYAGSR